MQSQSQQQAQEGTQQTGGSSIFTTVIRLVIAWMVLSSVFGWFRGGPSPDDPNALLNVWPIGTPFHVRAYLSSSKTFLPQFSFLICEKDGLIYDHSGVSFDEKVDWMDESDMYSSNLRGFMREVENRNTLVEDDALPPMYLHLILAKEDYKWTDESAKNCPKNPTLCFLHSRPISERRRNRKEELHNLAFGDKNPSEAEQGTNSDIGSKKYRNYMMHKVDISLLVDDSVILASQIPPHLSGRLSFNRRHRKYFPVVLFNDFFTIKDDYFLLNATDNGVATEISPFEVNMWAISSWKMQVYAQIHQYFNMQAQMGMGDEDEAEIIKKMVLDNNPWYLGLTMIVSTLHSIFDFLAFKNDVSFFKNTKTMKGISVRTLFVNFISQVIILLYLLDEETSLLITISSFVGLAIEGYKIKKAVRRIEFFVDGKFYKFRVVEVDSYQDSRTKEYDERALHLLSYAVYPLLVMYTIYSFFYKQHRGVYSFLVHTAVGFIYMFGFLSMLPQLFINYKLKSVAHMPWKVFMYKALNTVIDDLFAFAIQMPLLHRISCFRDDIVFVIYLYQWWIYPVDKKRANEFGQVFEEGEEEKKEEKKEDIMKSEDVVAVRDVKNPESDVDSQRSEQPEQPEQLGQPEESLRQRLGHALEESS
eukprot:TRINITY_DN3268_c0_g1_i1.p1 TRINITY_DN3268_c0_g1~~TRINITY_DN3268_c0_g1_i1.p1  ORF type:complete len:645 (-),score=165.46 TRINITY_DN3268_c0_g1_i1:41-1975(-)